MLLAMVASLLGVGLAAQPAFAVDAGVTVSVSPSSVTLGPGQSATINVTVTNTSEPDATPMAATLAVSGGSASANDITVGLGSGCDNSGQSQAGQATCNFTAHTGPPPAKAVANLVFTLKAAQTISDVVPGGKATFSSSSVSVVESPAINSPVSKGFSLTLNGPAPPPSSTISGVVDDVTTGQPVANALVNLQDAANHSYLAHSSSSGKFSFTAGGSTPVVAGPVVIGASKNGYQDFTGTPKTFTPGQNLTGWRVLIKPVAALPSASASATPSASASSGLPSPTDGLSAGPSDSGAVVPPGSTTAAGNSSGMSGPVKVVLVLGVLLLLAGAAVAIYLLVRRKRDDLGGDPDGAPTPTPGDDGTGYMNSRPMAMPEATMIARQGPAAHYGDAQTMVHPLGSNMGAPTRAAAPPTMTRPVDPYQGAGYSGGGGYGAADATTYAATGYGGQNRPASGAGYGGYNQPGSGAGYPGQNQPGSGAGYTGHNQPGSGAGYPGQNRPASGAGYGGYNQPGSGAGYPGPNQPGSGAGYPGYNQPGSGAGYPGQNQPASGAGYGQPTRAPYPDGPGSSGDYGANATGYGSSGGYGQQGNGAATYGQPSRGPVGYEQPEYPANGYGTPYGQQGGNAAPDYSQTQGYGDNGYGQPAYDANQYGQHGQHGYDDQAGYGGAPGYNGQSTYGDNAYPQANYDANGYAQADYGNQASYDGQHAPSYDANGYQADNGYPADNGYGDAGNGQYAGNYESNGYADNGYDANSYNTNGYETNGYDTNAYDSGPADQHSAPAPGVRQGNGAQGGYRGGYVPPDQRGSVDWLDD